MKMKKTKNGFSFKAENSEDSKLLGKLVVEMSKSEKNTAKCRVHDVNCTHWEAGNVCGILPPVECNNRITN